MVEISRIKEIRRLIHNFFYFSASLANIFLGKFAISPILRAHEFFPFVKSKETFEIDHNNHREYLSFFYLEGFFL
ncbi:MAG: hypothetical protein DRP06_03245 [Candidatus Aenigmatarchaeota archaeon]|nr:MAG: hypothetical protein DRP06_03245 [Candidatus Aenigmarchaeota archaeon]